ncbi:D-methionine transport system substrate-binding protein [Streptococcus criceti]|uniref:Lipoprotein n=1 Tax=Streptococcus criceti HS-6 TaxID=873449 RepID=G5JSP9_STRCG|nr:MetQ/NlpA family ABC transporter substrate-binding protein [Streptococcus criceti]EHI73552.1 lipoprotein, NPLA family [Streptococcus criceti HS-6]SUN37528.1 D-methionine transport system substrate-binding protein [Streptococcus criceti]
MKWKKIIGIITVVAAATLFLTACGSKSNSKNELKVGIMTLDDTTKPVWDQVKKDAAKKGITIKYVQFTDYNQPNKALSTGQVDVNAFQHYYFLNNWNKENKGNLVAVGDTLISPIRLFSKTTSSGKEEYSDVKDLPEGAKIAIPNDASNESRALFLLQAAGLIKLSTKNGDLATLKDITENSKNIDITEVSAEQLVTNLKNKSLDAAVINNAYAQEGKIDYKTTLYTEKIDATSKDWVNVIAAKKDWKKSDKADDIKTLVKIYQSDKIAKLIDKSTHGVDRAAWKGAPKPASSGNS